MADNPQTTAPVTLKRGTGTLTSGTVTITDSAMLTTSMVVLTDTSSSLTNVGALIVKTKSNGSFIVTSTNVLDSSAFDYVIMNP